MKEQFDIAPARKRAGVTQREVELDLGLTAWSLGAIEDGRIGIDQETRDRIHEAIERIGARKKGAETCDGSEDRSLASSSLAI